MSKILIIEDEEAIADLEKDYLELSGFEVEIEHRGDVGLKRVFFTTTSFTPCSKHALRSALV